MENGIFNAKEIKLENGIELVTIKRDSQIFSVHCGIKIGSMYENEQERGISHFIEHMLFKGTKNRNNETLNNDLEERAGEYNAYTDHNCTVYSITALYEEIEKSVELLSDMIINSIFPKDELEKERGVIIAEIKGSKDDIEDFSFQKANSIAFKNSSLRYDTAGEESAIKKIKREDLVKFYNKYYSPSNLVISVVSPLDHEHILKIVKKYFGIWKKVSVERIKPIIEDNNSIKRITYKKDISQSTIIYLYTFHNLSRVEELALRVLNHRLGESSNSLLFRELREEKGLAYDIYTQIDTTDNVKMMYIYTAISYDKVDEAMNIINACVKNIKNETITFNNNIIELMKKVYKTAVASTLEDSTDLGNYVLHQKLDNESIYQFIQDMKDIENVDRKQIYDVARKVLDKPTIHILLPEKSE